MDPAARDALTASKTAIKPPEGMQPLTSVADRATNLEALTLAFAAENNMSLRDVPKLVEYAKVG